MEVKAALMGEDYEKLKNWQKDAYHKQMIGGFKETKEAEDGFRKAQKPWAKKLKEVWISELCGMIKSHQVISYLNVIAMRKSRAETTTTTKTFWHDYQFYPSVHMVTYY